VVKSSISLKYNLICQIVVENSTIRYVLVITNLVFIVKLFFVDNQVVKVLDIIYFINYMAKSNQNFYYLDNLLI